MRQGELECLHGVGHSAGVHGCDGCCIPLVRKAKAEAWEEGCRWGAVEFQTLDGKLYDEDKVQVTDADNPYRQGETE